MFRGNATNSSNNPGSGFSQLNVMLDKKKKLLRACRLLLLQTEKNQ